MAGRPRKTIRTEIIEGEGVAAPITEQPQDQPIEQLPIPSPQEEELNKFFSSFGVTSGRIKVYRLDSSGNWPFLGSAEPSVVTEEWIQEQFGGGKYQIKLYDAKADYVASKIIYIGGQPITAPAPGTPQPIQFRSLPDTGNLQIDLLRSELAANREIVLKMIEAFSHKNDNGSGSTFSEVAAAMATLEKVVRPQEKSPFADVGQMFDLVKKAMEMGAAGAGGNGGKESWLGLAREVVGAIPAAIGAFKAEPMNNPPNEGEPMKTQIPTGNNPLGIPQALYIQLRGGIEYLKNRCQLGKDPGLWVDMILDNLDQPMYAQMLGLIRSKTLDEVAALTDPEIATSAYREWFTQLWKGITDAIQPATAPDGAVSDTGNTAKDGGIVS